MNRKVVFDFFDLGGRLLLSALFVHDLWSIAIDYSGTAGFMAQNGVPGILLPLVILVQAAGCIFIILGWHTRIGALALAGFCISTAVIFHSQPEDPIETIQFWKDLALAGGFLVLAANGARQYSLDRGRSPGGD